MNIQKEIKAAIYMSVWRSVNSLVQNSVWNSVDNSICSSFLRASHPTLDGLKNSVRDTIHEYKY